MFTNPLQIKDVAETVAAVIGVVGAFWKGRWAIRKTASGVRWLWYKIAESMLHQLYERVGKLENQLTGFREAVQRDLSDQQKITLEHNRIMQSLVERVMDKVGSIENSTQELKAAWSPNGGSSPFDQLMLIAARQRLEQNDDHEAGFETDSKGRCLFANRKYLTMTGKLQDEVLGYGWFNVVHHDDRDRIRKAWDRAEQDNSDFEDIATIQLIDNQDKEMRIRATRLISFKGSTLGYYFRLEPA
ncbi:MAG: PAS domain-containing protein [Bacteroidota bacterium]